jgi:glycosyltransferase involved in cell wall biosynthesis
VKAERLRVCLVSPLPPPYGGIGNWTLMMLRHARARSDVSLDVVDISPRWRARHDMTVWKRVIGGGVQLCRDLARFGGILVRRHPRVVHVTTPGRLAPIRDVVMIALAKAFRARAIYHIRFGRVPEIAEAGTREWRVMRAAIALADVVIPIDSGTERALREHVPAARVARVPNCMDFSALPPSVSGEGSRVVMFLGWLTPAKGLSELLEAWSRLKPPGWRLVVAGPGPEEYRRELLERYGHPAVEVVGELDHEHAMRALAAASVFVLPSHTEGFPNAVLEAMALGKAIVASEVGAIPEMLADRCGVLVPPRDVDQLAAALDRVIRDAELRSEMGQRARYRARAEYAIGPVFDRYLAIWRGRQRPPEASPTEVLGSSAGVL